MVIIRPISALIVAIMLLPTVLAAAEDGPPRQTELKGEAKAIAEILENSQAKLLRDHKVDAVLPLLTDDVKMIFGRGEKPGPYDIVLDRPKIEAMMRAVYHGKPDAKRKDDFGCPEVDLSGNEATVRHESHSTSPKFEEISAQVVHLRKTKDGWKVYQSRTWLVYRKYPGKEARYTPEKWKSLDEEVDRCMREGTLYELVAALTDACRFNEAYTQAKEMTEEDEHEATAWLWRGYTATALGHMEDARRSYRRARALDPKAEVPEFVKVAEKKPEPKPVDSE
ncbi:MAG: hypothetical protein JW888_18580 [Pirellulales bacterium]|nr:hypothetical protein [Pirellulales bacterium]